MYWVEDLPVPLVDMMAVSGQDQSAGNGLCNGRLAAGRMTIILFSSIEI